MNTAFFTFFCLLSFQGSIFFPAYGQGPEQSRPSLDLQQRTSSDGTLDLSNLRLNDQQLSLIFSSPAPTPEFWDGLKGLNLSSNALTTLPQQMGQLTNLKVLNVRYNSLNSLPDQMGGLKKLEHLDLSNNELTDLPYSITNLESLKLINLSNNQITSLPFSMLKWIGPNLIFLDANKFEVSQHQLSPEKPRLTYKRLASQQSKTQMLSFLTLFPKHPGCRNDLGLITLNKDVMKKIYHFLKIANSDPIKAYRKKSLLRHLYVQDSYFAGPNPSERSKTQYLRLDASDLGFVAEEELEQLIEERLLRLAPSSQHSGNISDQ